jgi:alpha-tubulin suppressor-like RCC1 family protein
MMRTMQKTWHKLLGSVSLISSLSLFCSSWSSRAVQQVFAWGDNSSGRTNLPSGLTNVVAVAAGGAPGYGSHCLVLGSDGTVVAWGDNHYGQTNVPSGLTNIVAVSAGGLHSLALKADGTVVAWGAGTNDTGLTPDSGQSMVPLGLTNVVAIAAGCYHSLALKTDGVVVAWGNNSVGQTNVPRGLTKVVAVAAGYFHGVALRADGTVVTWGANYGGEPSVLTNVLAIAAGGNHSLALRADGTVEVWGLGWVPANLTGVVAVAAGWYHSLALKSDGTVAAWGNNTVGQTNVPTSLSNVVAIAAGYAYDLALVGDGPPFVITPPINQTVLGGRTVRFRAAATGAWPLTYQWQFNGADIPDATNAVLTLTDVRTLQAGAYSVKVRNALGVTVSPSALLTVMPAVVAVQPQSQVAVLGGTVSFRATVLGNDALAYQWLFNGEDLPGATNSVLTMANAQKGLAGRYAVAVSTVYGVAKSTDATLGVVSVAAWGRNIYGETNVPADLTNVVAIAAGSSHNLALKADGTVAAWGFYGLTNVPLGLTNVVAIACGSFHSLALKSDGTVAAWG